MEAIVAVYHDWGIGKDGTQSVVLHADRRHFREITKDAAIIVGRKTLADFPGGKPLPGRTNIVMTRQMPAIDGAAVVHSAAEALAEAEQHSRCIVVGGARVYRALFEYLDTVYVTKIFLNPESDSFFPDLDHMAGWELVSQSAVMEEKQSETSESIRYMFCTYQNIK